MRSLPARWKLEKQIEAIVVRAAIVGSIPTAACAESFGPCAASQAAKQQQRREDFCRFAQQSRSTFLGQPFDGLSTFHFLSF